MYAEHLIRIVRTTGFQKLHKRCACLYARTLDIIIIAGTLRFWSNLSRIIIIYTNKYICTMYTVGPSKEASTRGIYYIKVSRGIIIFNVGDGRQMKETHCLCVRKTMRLGWRVGEGHRRWTERDPCIYYSLAVGGSSWPPPPIGTVVDLFRQTHTQ